MHGVDVNLILGIINGLVGVWAAYKSRQNAKDIGGVAAKAVTVAPTGEFVVGTERARDRLKQTEEKK